MERVDGPRSVEIIGIANSWFIGLEPKILLPPSVVKDLKLNDVIESKSS